MTNHIPKEPDSFVYSELAKYEVNTVEGKVYRNGVELGSIGHYGYVLIPIGNRLLKRSHIVYWAHHNKWPVKQLDHDNRIRTDDKINNLKEVTEREQQQNRQKKDGLPVGVYLNGFGSKSKPYIAKIWNKKSEYLGCFATVEEASRAYQKRAEELQ